MSGGFDPLARAQSFIEREGGAGADREARAAIERMTAAAATQRARLLAAMAETTIEVVDTLPIITESYVGRMFYVTNGISPDMIVIGATAEDNIPVWMYLDFPSQTGDLFYLNQNVDARANTTNRVVFDDTQVQRVSTSTGGDRLYVLDGWVLSVYLANGDGVGNAINLSSLYSNLTVPGGLAVFKNTGTGTATVWITDRDYDDTATNGATAYGRLLRVTLASSETTVSASDQFTPGTLQRPTGIAVNSTGQGVFVCDTQNNRIVAYNSSGTQRWTTSVGPSASPLSLPQGITVGHDDTGIETLWVADTGNHRVIRYGGVAGVPPSGVASVGNVAYGEFGVGYAQFQFPAGIAAVGLGIAGGGGGTRLTINDFDSYVLVADTGNHRIQVLDMKDGRFITRFGSYGYGMGEMRAPAEITRSRTSRAFFVMDGDNHRVQEWRARMDGVEVAVNNNLIADTDRFNLLNGTNMSLTAAVDAATAEVDVTVATVATPTFTSLRATGQSNTLTLPTYSGTVTVGQGYSVAINAGDTVSRTVAAGATTELGTGTSMRVPVDLRDAYSVQLYAFIVQGASNCSTNLRIGGTQVASTANHGGTVTNTWVSTTEYVLASGDKADGVYLNATTTNGSGSSQTVQYGNLIVVVRNRV